MNRRVIGRIISISHNNVVAELYNNLGNYVTLYDGIRFVGEIGSYVAIDDINRRIIAEIIAVDEKSDMVSEKLNKAESHRYLRINLIGEICNGSFSFGVTKMPPVFSEIMIISEADLRLMLDINSGEIVDENGKTKLTVLPIGTSVIFPEYQVKVKLNEFFGFHFAVFGNTGAGKSNTIARLIQEVFTKTNYSAKGARFIVFDSNGEYENAFASIGEKNPAINVKFLSTARDAEKRLQIPVWALSVDDWAVLLHASEKTQVPIISRALDMIRVFDAPGDDENAKKVKNHIVASVIKDVLSSNENPTTQNSKILMTLSKFHTDEIKLDTIIPGNKDADINNDRGVNTTPDTLPISKAISLSFAKMYAPVSLMQFCDTFILPNVNDLFPVRIQSLIHYRGLLRRLSSLFCMREALTPLGSMNTHQH